METLANPPQIPPKLPSQSSPEPTLPPNPSDRRSPRAPKSGLSRSNAKTLDSSSFSPVEFLSLVRIAACDVSSCSTLDVPVLQSWTAALVREYGLVAGSISDLVDIEAPKGPQITDGLSPRRKKKSVAELFSATEPTRKKKEVGAGNLPNVETGSGSIDEGLGSPRRERKKSKYLSPPYAYEAEQPHLLKEEEEEGSIIALKKYAGISGDVIFSQLLLAASEPLNPKSNRPGKAIWGFFTELRNYMMCGDSEFENYLKSLDLSSGFEAKVVSAELVDEVKEAKLDEAGLSLGNVPKKRGRPKKDHSVGATNGVSVVDLGSEEQKSNEDKSVVNGGAMQDSGKNVERGQKRKSSEEGPNDGHVGNGSGRRKTRQGSRKKDENAAMQSVGLMHPVSYVTENLETMIMTLSGTSSDTVSVDSLKPEMKENLVSEIQGLLNKVKNFQT